MHVPLKHEIPPLKIFTKEILKIFNCWQHYVMSKYPENLLLQSENTRENTELSLKEN